MEDAWIPEQGIDPSVPTHRAERKALHNRLWSD